MTHAESLATLKHLQKWRQGADIEMLTHSQITVAINAGIKALERVIKESLHTEEKP